MFVFKEPDRDVDTKISQVMAVSDLWIKKKKNFFCTQLCLTLREPMH